MNMKFISALLVFLLLTSVAIPAATAAEAPQVYYELHDLCLCGAHEDLGHIPYLNWGIGYKAWIDKQTDNWKVFVHAGLAKKEFTITPETPMRKLATLRDFVDNVDKCKGESDQLSTNFIAALGTGTVGSFETLKGVLTDNSLSTILGTGGIVASTEEIHQFVIHFNSAKNAQKNAEKLFEVLKCLFI